MPLVAPLIFVCALLRRVVNLDLHRSLPVVVYQAGTGVGGQGVAGVRHGAFVRELSHLRTQHSQYLRDTGPDDCAHSQAAIGPGPCSDTFGLGLCFDRPGHSGPLPICLWGPLRGPSWGTLRM